MLERSLDKHSELKNSREIRTPETGSEFSYTCDTVENVHNSFSRVFFPFIHRLTSYAKLDEIHKSWDHFDSHRKKVCSSRKVDGISRAGRNTSGLATFMKVVYSTINATESQKNNEEYTWLNNFVHAYSLLEYQRKTYKSIYGFSGRHIKGSGEEFLPGHLMSKEVCGLGIAREMMHLLNKSDSLTSYVITYTHKGNHIYSYETTGKRTTLCQKKHAIDDKLKHTLQDALGRLNEGRQNHPLSTRFVGLVYRPEPEQIQEGENRHTVTDLKQYRTLGHDDLDPDRLESCDVDIGVSTTHSIPGNPSPDVKFIPASDWIEARESVNIIFNGYHVTRDYGDAISIPNDKVSGAEELYIQTNNNFDFKEVVFPGTVWITCRAPVVMDQIIDYAIEAVWTSVIQDSQVQLWSDDQLNFMAACVFAGLTMTGQNSMSTVVEQAKKTLFKQTKTDFLSAVGLQSFDSEDTVELVANLLFDVDLPYRKKECNVPATALVHKMVDDPDYTLADRLREYVLDRLSRAKYNVDTPQIKQHKLPAVEEFTTLDVTLEDIVRPDADRTPASKNNIRFVGTPKRSLSNMVTKVHTNNGLPSTDKENMPPVTPSTMQELVFNLIGGIDDDVGISHLTHKRTMPLLEDDEWAKAFHILQLCDGPHELADADSSWICGIMEKNLGSFRRVHEMSLAYPAVRAPENDKSTEMKNRLENQFGSLDTAYTIIENNLLEYFYALVKTFRGITSHSLAHQGAESIKRHYGEHVAVGQNQDKNKAILQIRHGIVDRSPLTIVDRKSPLLNKVGTLAAAFRIANDDTDIAFDVSAQRKEPLVEELFPKRIRRLVQEISDEDLPSLKEDT